MATRDTSLRALARWPLQNPGVSLATAAALVSSTALLVQSRSSTTSRRRKSKRQHLFSAETPIFDDSVALDHLLAAFGPDGRSANGTAPGCMVASPSKAGDGDSNNYWFQWPRDTGLCVRSLVGSLKQAEAGRDVGYSASEINRRIQDFITMSIQLQHTSNPSGTFETGGLGEPKFEVDGSAFQGSWGRPQNDGPALRSISAIEYAQHILTTRGNSDPAVKFVKKHLLSSDNLSDLSKKLLVRDDLNYIARAWKGQTYELWEEVNADAGEGGGHFHVLMTQRRALLQGIKLAQLNTTGQSSQEVINQWKQAVEEITARLERFWNTTGKINLEGGPQEENDIDWNDARNLSKIDQKLLSLPHCVPTLSRVNGQPKPIGADNAVLLAFTHGWSGDLDAQSNDDTWEPWSERALSTLNRNVEIFSVVYDVNKNRKPQDGVLCGRYPEDVYNGVNTTVGNPWFLTTFAVSNVLYLTIAHYARTSKPIIVNPATTLPLFTKAYPELQQTNSSVTYTRGSKEWEGILRGLRRIADNFLANASKYAADDGKMAEQIDRYTGRMRGARELSWSFASLLAAHQARSYIA
ncbi:unnamed protein product [Sympodiomycopsis kandeliae]